MILSTKKLIFWLTTWALTVFLLISFLKKNKQLDLNHVRNINHSRLEQAPQDESIIAIDNINITLKDLDHEYDRYSSLNEESEKQILKDQLPHKQLRQKLLEHMIENKIIFSYLEKVQEQLPANIKSTIKECLARKIEEKDSCHEKTVQLYVDTTLAKKIEVTSSEIKSFYDANIEKFKTEKRILIQHILVEKESLAKKISYRVNKDNFTVTAAEHSIAPEGSSGGYLGPFEKGELPHVFDSAFNLKKDKISKIHKSAYGFHIFFIREIYEPGYKSFFETKTDIQVAIKRNKLQKEYKKCLNTALGIVKVTPNHYFW